MTKKDLRTINIEDSEIDNLFDCIYACINRDYTCNEETKKKMKLLFDDMADAYDEIRY